MVRYLYIAVMTIAMLSLTESTSAQRYVAPRIVAPIIQAPPTLGSTLPSLDNKLGLPTISTPVIVLPPPAPTVGARPANGGCCKCPGSNRCSDTCCINQ